MRFLQLAFLFCFVSAIKANGEADNYDYFMCRMRVTNVTKSVVQTIGEMQRSGPQFESASSSPGQRTTYWHWEEPQENGHEVLYFYQSASAFPVVAVNYPDSLKDLSADQFTFRCSNLTLVNTSDGLTYQFEKPSYVLKLGGPQNSLDESGLSGRVRRPITVEAQTEVDCYMKNGYQPPFSMDEKFPKYAANGETFSIGCSSLNKCSNGEISGVSRCPPFLIPPTVAMVRNVGECCDQSVTKADVEKKDCPKDERGSAFEQADNKTYVPWQVRFQQSKMNKELNSKKKVRFQLGSLQCDGVIIEKNWFLTTQTCLNEIDNIRFLRPRSVKYDPTLFRRVSIAEVKSFRDMDVDLALAKIDLPFVIDDWTTQIQKVNLFWNQSVCEKFVQKNCHLLLGTEQKDDQNSSVVVGQVVDIEPAALNYLKRIKKQENLPILLGSGLVGWFGKANFLAGIYIGNSGNPDDPGNPDDSGNPGNPDDSDTKNFISSCYFLDAIQKKMRSS